MPCSPFCAGRSLRYNGRMIYVAADHAGAKANCFAFGGFARPESSRGEYCKPRACFGKPAESRSFTKTGTLNTLSECHYL